MNSSRLVLSLVVALSLCGCVDHIKQALEPLGGPPLSNEGAAPRASGPVLSAPATSPPAAVAPGAAAPAAVQPSATTSSNGDITLNFADADIREIARTVLGSILKVTYTIDPNVHGTATIQTAAPVSRDRALDILETLLAQNGATLTVTDGVYRVLGNQAAALSASLVGTPELGAGTKLVPLRFASAQDLATVLQPFLPPGGKVTPDAARNVLLVSGDAATRESLEEVIRAFDIDLLSGKSFALFPVNSGEPDKAAAELTKVLMSGENGALANVVQVIPMDRINAILVVSSQPGYLDAARRLFALVDRISAETARSWHVYYVRNGQSTDLEYVLQRAFTPDRVTSTGTSDTNRLGSTVPGLQISAANSGAPSANFGAAATAAPSSSPAAAPATTAAAAGGAASSQAAVPPGAEGLSPSEGDKAKDSIRIIANRSNNALLIYATPQEYDMIEAMLGKIDILPLQVEIDAVIAEVTLNDQLQYGVQFYFNKGGVTGLLSQNNAQTTSGLPLTAPFPGFVLAKTMGAAQVTLNALQAITKVRVLSSPQITVLDNETATLEVGDQVPYLTASASILQGASIAGTPIVNSIAYQETGVILQVIPRVNSGGLVTLDIAQEVSQPITTTTSTINSPTFSDRVVKSRVVVQDGQTIGLAGLISDNDTRSNGGLPYLKDIPVLGVLFGTQNNQRNRTELLVLLTPHVNYDQRGVRALTDDLRNKLWHAGLVPQQLERLPASGSADPNAHLRGEP